MRNAFTIALFSLLSLGAALAADCRAPAAQPEADQVSPDTSEISEISAASTIAAPLDVPESREQGAGAPTGDSQPEAAPSKGFDHDHSAFSKVLAAHVRGDRVDYEALRANRAGLDRYTASLEAVERETIDAWTSDQRFAFWINAYNAYTLQIVIDHYPVDSIRDIKRMLTGVWDIEFIQLGKLSPRDVEGKISLNHIEHEILRKDFKDARVHAAVNCASVGCPPLASTAFDAEHLDAQLEGQVSAWLADTTRNRVDREKGRLELSKIFEWFGEDFERDAGSIPEWLRRHGPASMRDWMETQSRVKISHLDYSWKLNDTK